MSYASNSDKLKLDTNVPVTIAVEFAEGLTVASNFGGDQVMFSLVDGRKFYCSPFVASKISSTVRAREPFTICKKEITNGNRRSVDYVIEPARGASASNVTPPTARTSVSCSEIQSHVNARPAPPPLNEHFPERRPAADPSVVSLLTMAGCGAIDAVLAIEKYAEARGLTDFAFGVENIQKFAACLFIELNRKAGRA